MIRTGTWIWIPLGAHASIPCNSAGWQPRQHSLYVAKIRGITSGWSSSSFPWLQAAINSRESSYVRVIWSTSFKLKFTFCCSAAMQPNRYVEFKKKNSNALGGRERLSNKTTSKFLVDDILPGQGFFKSEATLNIYEHTTLTNCWQTQAVNWLSVISVQRMPRLSHCHALDFSQMYSFQMISDFLRETLVLGLSVEIPYCADRRTGKSYDLRSRCSSSRKQLHLQGQQCWIQTESSQCECCYELICRRWKYWELEKDEVNKISNT